MADPFSVFTGALTVADVCVSVGGYLRTVIKTSKHVDKEIESLEREINAFSAVFTSLGEVCATSSEQQQSTSSKPSGLNDPSTILWSQAAALVEEGQSLVKELKELLIAILGDESSPSKFQKIEDVQKSIRLLSKNKRYNKIRRRLTDLNLELNTMLVAVDLVSNSKYRLNNFKSLEQLPGNLSQKLQSLGLKLKDQIKALENADEDLAPSIVSAKAAVAFTSLNEHYYVQKPDTSIWTGRRKYLDELKDAMLGPQAAGEGTQKRFVVHGISGAGKTQFCCKFAQDYRESFWGIFWVDASNAQNATESWKKIAMIGGKGANEEAGKFWLSNLQSPWLLIIDGADNAEKSIQTQFPSGDRGCILITTRNPRLSINATIGYLTLDRLEDDEADELLRKATKHKPWDGSARTSALSIAKHLGYLPLALIHAGRAIFHQLCTLHGYIPFFNSILNDYRKKKYIDFDADDDDHGMGVFTSFDIIYSGLEVQTLRKTTQGGVAQDAIELINMFSFLHNNDIHLEILIKAGKNLRETTHGGGTKPAGEQNSQQSSGSLVQRLREFAIMLYIKFKQPTPALPRIIRALMDQSFDESRARKAIDLLVRMSLLSESSETGSYSMHPLVHMWVRKRLSASACALWCGAAADVLASSVKIPPMVDEPGDDDFYVRILKHVNQVQTFQEEVKRRLWKNCHEAGYIRSWMWMSNPLAFTTRDALHAAKYSRIYMTCALFEDAEKLQRLVLDYIVKKLGSNNALMVPISIALSGSLWHLGRAAEAQELQENALQICKSQLGEIHPQTLKTMDALGETYWQRGWLKESKALHEESIRGMEGNSDLTRDRLKAMIHLGRVHEWYTEHELAQSIYEKAYNELAETYGEDDFDAMIAKDSLAMTLIQLNQVAPAKRANDLMQDIYQSRRNRLGEEHIYTLWAACNLARTLTVRGALENDQELLEQAKTIFRDGLATITRNLGSNHIGTLMGRGFFANVLVVEKKYDEAMTEYEDIAELQRNLPGARAGSHRDRLITLQRMVDCYEIQSLFEAAVERCTTIIKELDDMGGQKHPWRYQILQKREKLSAKISSANTSRI